MICLFTFLNIVDTTPIKGYEVQCKGSWLACAHTCATIAEMFEGAEHASQRDLHAQNVKF